LTGNARGGNCSYPMQRNRRRTHVRPSSCELSCLGVARTCDTAPRARREHPKSHCCRTQSHSFHSKHPLFGALSTMEAGADPAEAIVYVNGKRHVLPQGRAEATLLQYLRGARLHRSCAQHCTAPAPSRTAAPPTPPPNPGPAARRRAGPHRRQAGVRRGRVRRLHRDGQHPPGRRSAPPPLHQRLPLPAVRGGGRARGDGGGHRQRPRRTAPGAGAAGQGARLAVRLLHPGIRDVHVRAAALQDGGAAHRGGD
jgi:hypothetical protein